MPQRCLYGWQRKFALVPLGLFMVGWLVFAVGHIWRLIVDTNVDTNDRDPSDSFNYPYYVTLAGGPIIYLLGALHAILPGVASAIVWIVVASTSTVYFASASWVMYDSGLNSTSVRNNQENSSHLYNQITLMFEGTLFSIVCWNLVLILTIFYKNAAPQRRTIRRGLFPGMARCLTVPLLALSAAGWCLFVVGYHLSDYSQDSSTVFDERSKPVVIAVFITGPFLFLASLLHAGFAGDSTFVMGVFLTTAHKFYVMTVGFVVIHLSHYIMKQSRSMELKTDNYLYYMLGGALASLFFWTVVHALWPFYQVRSNPEGDHNDGRRHPRVTHRRGHSIQTESLPPSSDTRPPAYSETETQPLLENSAE